MKQAFAIFAVITAMVGCDTPRPYTPQVNTLTTGTVEAKVDHVAYRQVVLDGFQAQCLYVEDVRRSKTNDGYDRVEVLVKNMTNASLRMRYRFDWQDANGVLRSDLGQDAWEKTTIAAGDNSKFTSIAPRKDCADFRLRMKNIQ